MPRHLAREGCDRRWLRLDQQAWSLPVRLRLLEWGDLLLDHQTVLSRVRRPGPNTVEGCRGSAERRDYGLCPAREPGVDRGRNELIWPNRKNRCHP